MYRPADRFSWRDAFKCSCLLVVLALTFISISISTTEESRQTFYDILHVPFDATDADIKKSYRLLALEYHPDKIFQFNPAMTEEEKNETNDIFLKVQEAYETLHDSERRLQYDLKLTGVQYDIVEDEAPSPYMSRPFQLFVKSPRFKMAFYANFAKPKVPDIHIIVDASLENALHGLEVNQKFYRRVICPFCRGKGGLDGECKGCMQCDGTGVAKLLYSHYGSGHQTARTTNTPTFEQMSESTCQSCQGKGCIPIGKCLNCQGSGTKMVETDVLVSVPKGFKNGIKLSLENAGHEDIDGRRGDVTVTVQYVIPSDWIITEDRHEVFHNKVITLDSFKHNRTFNVYSPLGDTVAVKIPKLDFQLGHLLEGFNVTVRGFGLLTGEEVKVEAVEEDLIDLDLNMESELDITGNQKKNKREETASTADKRGNLIVHFDIDWSSVGQNTFQDLLLGSGWKKTDPMYLKICSMLDICEIENKEKGMGASGDGGAFSILPKEITIISRT